MMAKCQGPAPLGVGTITANVPPTNMTNAARIPKCAVKVKIHVIGMQQLQAAV